MSLKHNTYLSFSTQHAHIQHIEAALADLEAAWAQTQQRHDRFFISQTQRLNRIGQYAPLGIAVTLLLVFIHIGFFFLGLGIAIGSTFYIEMSSEDEDHLIQKRAVYLEKRNRLLRDLHQAKKAEATPKNVSARPFEIL